MNAPAPDPWEAKLSDYFDGDLALDERRALERHLEGCAACARALADLGRLAREARALEEHEPTRDLWPAIEARLDARRVSNPPDAPRASDAPAARRASDAPDPPRASDTSIQASGARTARVRRWVGIAAALLLTGLLGWTLATRSQPNEDSDPRPRFALLLHEPAGLASEATPEEIARIVDEYRQWGRSVARSGRLVDGEKLADREGFVLRADGQEPRGDVAGLGGFFLVRAATYEEALEIARGCPHLRYGGWIEVRRIEET